MFLVNAEKSPVLKINFLPDIFFACFFVNHFGGNQIKQSHAHRFEKGAFAWPDCGFLLHQFAQGENIFILYQSFF
jgi:hypothetical protein